MDQTLIGRSDLSVVIPVYNGRATILAALRSVLAQSMRPNEVIVVDDGSRDDTARLVTDFIRQQGLKCWRLIQQENRGVGHARDVGVRASTGHWIALLDADDTWEVAKLERSVACLGSMNLDIVGARLTSRPSGPAVQCTVIRKRDALLRNPYFTSTVVFTREAYLNVGGFDPRQRYSEDYKLWLNFVMRGKRAGLLSQSDANYSPATPSARGLSTRRWLMEKHELGNFASLYESRLISPVELGVAYTVSLMKFVCRLFSPK
jgi:glycosyltransferase involved in cell wall biosynthesis